MGDRRIYLGYQINLPVFIFSSEKRAVAHTLDVGLGGMKIYTDQVFPSGREFLFQLVLKRKSIWIKGRFIFEQTHPELVNFSCIQFVEASKESIFNLQEFFSHSENLLKKEWVEMELRIREREAALAKAAELLKVEIERRKRGEQVLQELGERLGYLSSEFSDCQEKKLKMTIQGLHDSIEATVLAINDGLKNIHLLLEDGSASDQISFEQIIFNIQNNYKMIRKILENLWPSISDELGLLATIGWHCQEFRKVFDGIENEKEIDILEERRSGASSIRSRRKGASNEVINIKGTITAR